MKTLCQLTCLLVLFAAQSANAAIIEYNLSSLGGNSYQYDYTVTNDGSLGAGVAIEWFAILFDPALYDEASLAIVTPEPLNSDWDQLILGSGLLIPAAYDAIALSSGIAEGESLGGFAVQFNWLGIGLPGSQDFEVYDPDTFDILLTGRTARPPSTSVPEPNTLVLLLLAGIALTINTIKRNLNIEKMKA